MATIAIGDIHGNLAALNDILEQVSREIAGDDTVVFLGDYIDRGHESKGCVDAILGFQNEVSVEVICLIGNHEDWFLRTLHDHGRHSWLLGMEAFDTIRSYSVVVSAASRAFVIAASVACAVAWNSGVIRSFGSIFTSVTGWSSNQARALAVENATKISPELLPPKPPWRPTPTDTRVAMRHRRSSRRHRDGVHHREFDPEDPARRAGAADDGGHADPQLVRWQIGF